MKTLKLLIAMAAFLVGFGYIPAHGSVLFEDTTWYAAGASSTIAVSDGKMDLTIGSGNFALTYLTASGSYISLAIGSQMTFAVSFSSVDAIGASASGLRFGLLNSGANRISADNAGQSSTTYSAYTGYVMAFGGNSLTSSSLTSAIWERSSTNNALINSSSAYNTSPGTGSSGSTSTSTTPAMAADTVYTMTLTLDYIAAGNMLVTSTLTGGSLASGGIVRSYTDTTPYTSFDTVVLFSTSSFSSNMEFSAVSVVPEPSAAGLLLGTVLASFGGAVFCARRRISRRQ